MITIPGYQIFTKIYESTNSLVYRGCREQDNQPVILKVLKEDYPTPSKLARYKQEYQITRNLNLERAIKAYSLEKYQNTLAIALEDFGGQSLDRLLKERDLTIGEFLEIAIQITEGLGTIHGSDIIHKDINPSNIVFNPENKQLKIIDFGISTVLPRENPTIQNPTVLEGTLAYISPEQTGRMNRQLDYRTDFYSLGATFYELLTQQLLFETIDPMELVHYHLAKQPVSPHELNPEIPKAVSGIIMKLLSKRAEDRYQSAWVIKADLEECLSQLQAHGNVSDFYLAQQDISNKFQIPQKLYGRKQEIEKLLTAFERVCANERFQIEMMLISGYSGIGKSALVREIYQPITKARGYFISGKFDQYQRNIPYFAVIKAFQELVRQLLTESESELNQWRQKLSAALGVNCQVIIDVIPKVELIVGKQPPVTSLPPAEAQNRLNLVFQNFIQVFTKSEHPLVIFLDDLQWADPASLQLMQMLMTAPDSKYLFLIGAYRDNEVSATHPLMLTLDEIQKAKAVVNHISLSALELPDINYLISDTLNCTLERGKSLAELVQAKTNGNPFFVKEFLKSLYTEKLLKFNYTQGLWQWNLEEIQVREITDNVVELMAFNIQKLQHQTQQVLKMAACIGNQFDLQNLAIVFEKSPRETAASLREAMAEGLVSPLSDAYKSVELDVPQLANELTVDYKFLHDRIQQAAYSLIPAEQKQIVHRQVGQLLLQNTPLHRRAGKIFDIVNQLNWATELIKSQSERDELAQLNLVAGKKAKASAAYESAFKYLNVGLGLLGEDNWLRQYDLTLELCVEVAEAAYLSAEFEQMETLVQVVLQQAKNLLDKVKVYEVKIQACQAQNKPQEAIKTATSVLKLLGVRLPENPRPLHIWLGLLRTKLTLAGKRIEDLSNLPSMTDPYHKAAMRIILSISAVTYFAFPELLLLLVFKQVNLSVKHGNTSVSAWGYAAYGGILCFMGDTDSGYQFGLLALSLLDKFNDKALLAQIIYTVNSFIRHWQEPVEEVIKSFLPAYQIGLETGDLYHAAWAAFAYCFYSYFIGKELASLEREMASYSEAIGQLKQEIVLHHHQLYRQIVWNLDNLTELPLQFPCELIGEYYNEQTMLPLHLEANDRNAIFHLYLNKTILCYLFYNYSQAVENATNAINYLDGVKSSLVVPIFYFYDSLARLAVVSSAQTSEQKRLLTHVATNQKKMKKWADSAPMNHLHKFYLMEAERHRVLGQDREARDLYDRVIELAKENKYINEEALANELAAKFYLANGKTKIAQTYMMDARYAYLRWGATAKVKHLEGRYPELLAIKSEGTATGKSIQTTSEQSSSEALDLKTVVKASQVLAGEIVLDKLLEKLMKIVIENAGAQKGYLILDKEGNWVIEAEGSVDSDDFTILHSIPFDVDTDRQMPLLSTAIINYVARTQKNVVLNTAVHEGEFTRDPYIIATQPKSILCTPLLHQGKLSGILYLENNLTTDAFTPERVEVLRILSAQAAISIENSRLYEQLEDYNRTLEQKVKARTQELQEKNEELASTLQKLKATQAQIVAQEKLASLGALAAGIAHEIKNPLNFVNNFAELSVELAQELLEEIENQKDRLDPETKGYIEEILDDLRQNAKKINDHGKRADNIVRGMLMLSRGQLGQRELTDINAMLAESINLAYHGMRAKDRSFEIAIETDYDDDLGKLNVVPQDISRAFINIINNACYAANEKKMRSQALPGNEGEGFSPTLSVSTKDLGERVEIRIRDNGKGIPQEVLDKIFNPFFTTKPAGEGTGLGLSISYDIIVQEHQGEIRVETEVGNYAEFIITLPKIVVPKK